MALPAMWLGIPQLKPKWSANIVWALLLVVAWLAVNLIELVGLVLNIKEAFGAKAPSLMLVYWSYLPPRIKLTLSEIEVLVWK